MSFGIVILLAVIVPVTMWIGVPFFVRRWQTRKLELLCRRSKSVLLTYDDGPSNSVTPHLLDLLASERVSATFFVIGQNAQACPKTLKRLENEGHEIAGHTQSHTNAWKVAPWTSNRDIMQGQRSLQRMGIDTALYRPTYGKTTLASLWLRAREGLRFVYWTIDTRDSWDRRPVQDILDELRRKGGGVVLMHDFDGPKRGPKPDDHLQYVLNTTRAIIDFARENDMKLRRFKELWAAPTDVARLSK